MISDYQLSVFESSGGRALSKSFALSASGELTKKGGGALNAGTVERVEVTRLAELLELLVSLKPSSAVAFGVTGPAHARVVIKKNLSAASLDGVAPVIARDRDHFSWTEGPGFLFLDYDPLPEGSVLEPDQLVALLRAAVPELKEVTIAHKPSTSSCIFDDQGREVRGLKGQHLFIALERAADAPNFGKIISERLWLAGQGDILVLANGTMKERSLFDEAVWQPERLIFTSAECIPPLRQRMEFALYPGEIDDLVGETALSDCRLEKLTPTEISELSQLKTEARAGKEQEASDKKEAWLEARAQRSAGEGADREEVLRIKVAMSQAIAVNELPADLLLETEQGGKVRVDELLKDPQKWEGKRFSDPIEPDYRGDNRIAVACLTSTPKPHIYSHAHGGTRYLLPTKLAQFAKLDHRPLEVIPAAEFVNGPPVSWIVKGYIPGSCLVMLFGAPASGKSFLAFDLMWAVARGTKWRESRVKQGKVVYIAAEGVSGARLRLRAYAEYHGIDLAKVPIGIVQGRPSLHRDDPSTLIAEIQKAGGADLIVIDTLAQVTAGADENSAQDMGAAIACCNEIIEQTGATVLLIHHSGKEVSRGARGWSGLKGAVDVEIKVSKGERNSVAEVSKMKDGELGKSITFVLNQVTLGTDEDGDPVTSCVVVHKENEAHKNAVKGKLQTIIMSIAGNPSCTGPISKEKLLELSSDEHFRVHKNAPRRDVLTRSVQNLICNGHLVEVDGRIQPPQNHKTPQLHNVESALPPPTPHPSEGGVVGGAQTREGN